MQFQKKKKYRIGINGDVFANAGFLNGSRLEFNWTVVDRKEQIKTTSIQSLVDSRSTHSFTFQMIPKP